MHKPWFLYDRELHHEKVKDLDYFHQKAPWMFDWIL